MRIKRISRNTRSRFLDAEMKRFFLESFPKTDSREILKDFSAKERPIFLGAYDGGKVIGSISLHLGYKTARIGAFAVAKGRRGSGIGTMLMDRCEAIAREEGCTKVWLWTIPSIPAYRFYLARGYTEEARLKRHFGGKDLAILSRFL